VQTLKIRPKHISALDSQLEKQSQMEILISVFESCEDVR